MQKQAVQNSMARFSDKDNMLGPPRNPSMHFIMLFGNFVNARRNEKEMNILKMWQWAAR